MLSIVVPKITGLFIQLGQELPKLTKIVINAGKFVQNYWIDMIIITLLVAVIFSYLYKNIYKFAFFIDKLLLKLPLFGKIIQTSELAKFSYMVSVLLNSGVTFVQSIKLSSNTIKNRVLSDIFSKASDEIVKGKKLSSAIAKQHIKIDKVFMQSISLGEETSQIKEVLESLSEFYTEENKDKLEKMISLLEPVLMLVVGAIVGVIISAMLLPIFSINFKM
jgi:general secretion pathway protein F/type IV pilus assembly protein PilC